MSKLVNKSAKILPTKPIKHNTTRQMRRKDLPVCWFDANQVKQAPQNSNGIKKLHLTKIKNKIVIKPRRKSIKKS